MMKKEIKFEALLIAAQNGDSDAMSEILEMYMPLINKHSHINGVLNEDLRQEILIHIVKNIAKFNF